MGFFKKFLLYNGVPCILHLNLQWYHILIKLPANSTTTQLQKLWIYIYSS